MKLPCSVAVGNRLQATVPTTCKKKHVNSTLSLVKNQKSEKYSILLFSAAHKNGKKYELNRITKVLTRFVNEGKVTIQFEIPPEDLYVQADAILLKSFLNLLKKAIDNKISKKEANSLSMSATPVKSVVKKLVIIKRSDYPTKGFPRTVEVLHMNNIKRCSLDQGILQLFKLRLLDVSHNNIEYLPHALNTLPCLSELNVSHNEFGKSSIKQWSWLGDNNLIKSLPSGIGSLAKLQFFTASNNMISILPGSIVKLKLQNLDLSNNNFSRNYTSPAAIFLKHLPVRTLKEYAGRQVLHLRLPYSLDTLPCTIIEYLDYTTYCVCGLACFDTYIKENQMLLLRSIAQTLCVSSNDLIYVPINCHFCSLKCFGSTHYDRVRQPFI
ncbi:hypothetical protein FQA39_LY09874 [Lamprigera yunnana]|nr:hypothetical protein FQA39_LY09874 [Lamprigera yunnana]